MLGFGRLGFVGNVNGRGSVVRLRRDAEGIYMLSGREVAHVFGLKVPTKAKIELLADEKAENIFRITFLGEGNFGYGDPKVGQEGKQLQQVQPVNEVQQLEEVQQVEQLQQEVHQVEEVPQVGIGEVQQEQDVNEVQPLQEVQIGDDFEITVTEAMCNLENLQLLVLIKHVFFLPFQFCIIHTCF